MQHLFNTAETSKASLSDATLRVGNQKKTVAEMQSNNSGLKSARAILHQMQQNVAIAQMNVTLLSN